MKFPERLRQLFSRDSVLLWVLILAGVLVYLNSLPNEMFWDDDDFILKNAYIQDWANWPHFFKDNIISGAHLLSNYWRPVLQIVFAMEWHLWADWTPGWHAVSILVHAIDGALLFLLLKELFHSRALAFLTAAMFILHPAQSEAVVYPNSLGDGLANLFVFCGLLLFVRFRASDRAAGTSPHWWGAFFCYPLALMSKETGILFLAYLILADWILRPTQERLREKILATMKAVWPFLLIAVGYMILRATVLNFNNSFNFYKGDTILSSDIGVRVMTFLSVLSTYTGLLFIPYDLRVERLLPPAQNFWQLDVIGGALACALLVGLAWRNRRRAPIVTFGVLWFFAGIAPTSNLFVLINALVYEHFLYTALVGIWLIVFWAILTWAADARRRRRIVIAGCAFLFAVFAGRVLWRNTDWRTAVGFYEKLLPTAQTSYRVINNLGMEYAEHSMLDKAVVTYEKAIALDPTNAVAYHNLGNIYRDRAKAGDVKARDKAIELFEKAITLQENFIFSYNSLAQLYLDRGDLPKARMVLEKFFVIANAKLPTIDSLIKIALAERNLPAARRYAEVKLQLLPNDADTTELLKQINAALKK